MELQKVDVDKIKLELIAIPQVSSVSSLKLAVSCISAATYQSESRWTVAPDGISSFNRKKSIRHRENQLFAEERVHKLVDISKWIEQQDVPV